MGMDADIENLHKLNMDIGVAESEGTVEFFRGLLATAFAMRRASGTTDTRDTFICHVKQSNPRTTRDVSVTLLGKNRAAVNCIVEMQGRQYENFRLFIRETENTGWKLLAWANEPIQEPGL